jgi:hypothetical protein
VGNEHEGRQSLGALEWQVNELRRWRKENIDPLQLPTQVFVLSELREEVKALKRALYTFAFAVVLAAVTFAFTVLTLIK